MIPASPPYFKYPKITLMALVILTFLSGCGARKHATVSGIGCNQIDRRIDFDNRIVTLNIIAEGFYYKCFDQVIHHGARALEAYRQKTFSITKEAGNIFLPEGILLDYVMESYERAFLTFLLASSYYKTDKKDASKVELRRLDHELKAGLYNYGEDPVNIILQGILWEKLDEADEARIDWKNLQNQDQSSELLRSFASARMLAIDQGTPINKDWKIYAIGRFPEITWDLKFVDNDSGYFTVRAKRPFLKDCVSETGFRVSTKSWVDKIAMRHDDGYHPLINARSWIRLPIGIVYGITTFSSGAAIMIGGCALDAYGEGNGALCQVSIQGGVALMAESPKVLKFTLKPDFRHWENVPEGFAFTTADDLRDEKCLMSIPKNIRYHLILS